MRHSIQLSDVGEARLRELAAETGRNTEELLAEFVERLLASDAGQGLEGTATIIRSRPEIMGGSACIGETRIPVWLLVSYRNQGMTEPQILANYPVLSQADLKAAWTYYAENENEIEAEINQQREAS